MQRHAAISDIQVRAYTNTWRSGSMTHGLGLAMCGHGTVRPNALQVLYYKLTLQKYTNKYFPQVHGNK